MRSNVFTYILLILLLGITGCSDEFDFRSHDVVAPDGTVEMTLNVPGMRQYTSRAVDPEFQVNDLTLVIYPSDASGNVFPRQTFTVSNNSVNSDHSKLEQLNDTQLRLSFRLDNSLRSGSFQMFIFANKPSSASLSNLTVNDLKAVKSRDWGQSGVDIPMFSYITKEDLSASANEASLSRVSAKVSISDKQPGSGSLTYFPIALFGAADEAVLTAPGFSGDEFFCPGVAPASFPTDITSTDPLYFPQTKNDAVSEGPGRNLYLITKANYDGTDYFYRLDFCRESTAEDGSTVYDYLNALCNHWYQFVITEVTGRGYASPAEAAKHPANGIKYVIHDHSPVSYNMISDGIRELGVSHTLIYSGDINADGEWSDLTLYVKLFSRYPDEVPSSAAEVNGLITIEDDSWLELSAAEKVTDPEQTGITSADDPNDAGTVYALRLRFKNILQWGAMTNNIKVRWLGLERDVPVIWERGFNAENLTSVKLTMSGSPIAGGVEVIDDYWGFLKSADPYYEGGAVTGVNNLWGVQPVANNGKIRNRGFHFPVMYGDGNSDSDYAKYSYEIKFDKTDRFNDANGGFNALVSLSLTGDAAITNQCKCEITSKSPLTIKLERPGRVNANDYSYATGNMVVIIKFDSGDSEIYSFDLYHTGFFHKDSQQYRLDAQDSGNYYYYEVIPVQLDGKTRYMLDRDLAARSAQNCIIEGANQLVTGSLSARGGYYMIAEQTTLYTDPTLFPGIAPPGYRIPDKNDWDALRQSSSFHTDGDNRNFTVYYETGNPKIGNVYFPKSMMWLNGNITGEDRSGYYWTTTAATGAEKEEIGRWLNMFVLTGSATSFSNGKVLVGGNRAEAFGASIRCLNDVDEERVVQRTHFNVSGATHVYLYSEDGNGVRTATTTWPGHSVGNYATMTDGVWMGFSYSSSQFSPSQLKVIFNYIDEKGVIYSFSRKSDGTTQCTTTLSPDQCIGWNVVGDTSPAIIPSSGLTTMDDIALDPASVSALGNWWLCQNYKSGTPSVKDYKRGIPTEYNYAFYWPSYMGNSPEITVDGKSIFEFDETANRIIPGWYRFTFSSTRPNAAVNIKIRNTSFNITGSLSELFGSSSQSVNSAYLDYYLNFVKKTIPESVMTQNNITNPIPAGMRRVYMENAKGWPMVRIWYWKYVNENSDSFGNQWGDGSGVPKMTSVAGYDNKIWYADIPDSATHCLFVCVQSLDGTPAGQTADIILNSDPNYLYSNY